MLELKYYIIDVYKLEKKFSSNIIAKSTFSNNGGTRVCREIENTEVKSIVKNEKLIEIKLENSKIISGIDVYQNLLENNIIPEK